MQELTIEYSRLRMRNRSLSNSNDECSLSVHAINVAENETNEKRTENESNAAMRSRTLDRYRERSNLCPNWTN